MVLYILRECMIVSAMHLQLMSLGITMSFPSVLAADFTSNRTEIQATPDEVAMILGGFGIFGPFTFMLFPTVMQLYGRKITNILLNLCTLSGSLCVAMVKNVPTLVAGRFIQGLAFGGYYISCVIAAEYVHPKRRGFQIVVKGASACIGAILCHSLGLTIWTYKQVAWMATIPSILSILITLMWPESPLFLAYKGRYDECTKAFEWIRGTSSEAKKELQELITSQEKSRQMEGSTGMFKKTLNAFGKKDFLKPLSISMLLSLLFQATGGMVLVMYVSEIINKITGDRSTAFYYTIGLDVMRMMALSISSCIVRLFRRRVLLFSSSSASCSLLVLLIVLYYLDKISVINGKWLNPAILVLYYIVVSVFIVPLVLIGQGEIIPMKYKGIESCVVGFTQSLVTAAIVQYSWQMIWYLDIHGLFTIFLVFKLTILTILYFMMPETRDRTLQNIENDFVRVDVKCDEVCMNITEQLVNKK